MSGEARALALTLLAGCSTELLVLEQLAPGSDDAGAMGTPAPDAARDEGDARVRGERDADMATDGASGDDRSARAVVSAFAQTCVVVDDELWCWGQNEQGQVGVRGPGSVRRPLRVSDEEFLTACAGERHSCALRRDGSAYCWGANNLGQLGLGDLEPHAEPRAVGVGRFGQLACGGDFTCAITPRGELWCWGDNREGQLAQGDPPPQAPGTLPRSEVPIAIAADERFLHVSAGQGHACAIADQGALYCWGRNTRGQLGVGESTMEQLRKATHVAPGKKFEAVAAGQFHTCAIDDAHQLWCWGENHDGRLGFASDQRFVRTPTALAAQGAWAALSASWFHTCALTRDGELACWGRNLEGQLGQGDSMTRAVPTRVPHETRFHAFGVGHFHTCAWAEDGLFCWGANDTGQLGFGDDARHYVPRRVTF